tara:strand:- start:13742 stop:14512 length:771 start_codon:yes stop_codon:yes gene_type:complete
LFGTARAEQRTEQIAEAPNERCLSPVMCIARLCIVLMSCYVLFFALCVLIGYAMDGDVTLPLEVDKLELTRRLQREGRWTGQAEETRNALMKQAREIEGLDTKADRQRWAYSELDRMYPPEPAPAPAPDSGDVDSLPVSSPVSSVQGLGDLPSTWPDLPSNASLQSELSWVQSNRVLVVEERPTGSTRVHLDRARSPAPSWAALSWLETAIRTYAKFVDVVAKSLKEEEQDAEHVRRERRAIAELESILAEMHEDD